MHGLLRVSHANRPNPHTMLIPILLLLGTLGSTNYMIGGLGIIPKATKFAYDMQRLGVTHVHAHFANHPTVAALVISGTLTTVGGSPGLATVK